MAPLTAIHLCSGYGGFELALRDVARVRTVCHVERDAYAAAILVERMGEARLDQAPIWDDLGTFDGAAWRRRVDIVTAGFPCQPFSAAGRKRGTDDERWLWPDVARIVDLSCWKTSQTLFDMAYQKSVMSLPRSGFDAEWGCFSAAAVGAPHVRERFWLVADTTSTRRAGRPFGRPGSQFACPPLRGDHDAWARWTSQCGPEPVLRRDTDGPPTGLADTHDNRSTPTGPPAGLADALHLGGNGLVPQCAAEALRQLLNRTEMTP